MSSLVVGVDGDVARIRFNQPEQGNRLTQDGVIELGRELGALAAAKSLKAVVLSGAGDHFCQGRVGGPPPAVRPSPLALRSGMMGPILDVYRAMRAIEVPILALVQGEANGFGAALAASADITIAADTARFSFPEMRSDMPPTLAMATVQDRVATKTLQWMVYTTESIGALEALAGGLVSRVVPAAELEAAGEQTLERLLARRRAALCGVKQFLAQTQYRDFEHAADYGANLLAVTLSSQD